VPKDLDRADAQTHQHFPVEKSTVGQEIAALASVS
jgi:hypothetical protein